jgi:hypothetical protein
MFLDRHCSFRPGGFSLAGFTTNMVAPLVAGTVAGIGAITSIIHLGRRRLEIPTITIAAAVVGGVALCGSVLIIANIL